MKNNWIFKRDFMELFHIFKRKEIENNHKLKKLKKLKLKLTNFKFWPDQMLKIDSLKSKLTYWKEGSWRSLLSVPDRKQLKFK